MKKKFEGLIWTEELQQSTDNAIKEIYKKSLKEVLEEYINELIEESMEEAFEKSKEEVKKEIALKITKKKFEINFIAECTILPREEVEE